MASSGFMILCFQSPPQARHKMGEANLGTPPPQQNISKNSEANLGTPPQPQSISKKTAAKHFKKSHTHRQKPHTKKSLQSLTNLHKKVFIFAH